MNDYIYKKIRLAQHGLKFQKEDNLLALSLEVGKGIEILDDNDALELLEKIMPHTLWGKLCLVTNVQNVKKIAEHSTITARLKRKNVKNALHT